MLSYDSVFTGPFWTSQKIYCRIELTLFFFFIISENEENTLYVVACNPVSLYFMNMTGKSGHFVDLFDIFPRTVSGIWHPFVTVAPLGNPLRGQVVLHEQQVMASLYQEWLTWGTGRNVFQPITENVCFHKDWGEGLQEGVGSCMLPVPQGKLTPSSLGDFDVGFNLWNMLSERFLISG